jgi:hypothetical protein
LGIGLADIFIRSIPARSELASKVEDNWQPRDDGPEAAFISVQPGGTNGF